jgi:hypothetical protein
VKSSWEVLDKSRQTADLQSMSEVYSAAANRKFDLQAALMQRRLMRTRPLVRVPTRTTRQFSTG